MKHLYDAYSRNTYIAFVFVFLIGAALRLYGIVEFPFVEDSFYTIRDATRISFGDGGRPVFFLLQKAIFQVLPVSHFSLRLLPLTFGLLGIIVIWIVGNRFFGPTAGLSAAVLVALSPWHIYMSQIGRYWSLVFLEAALLVLLLGEAQRRPKVLVFVLAFVVSIVGIFTHPAFVFLVAGCIAIQFVSSSKAGLQLKRPRNRWAYSLILALSLVVLIASAYIWKKITLASALSTADLATSLRVIPAAIQWIGPAVVVASAVGTMAILVARHNHENRWWGALTVLIVLSFLAGMTIVGQIREIYSYYLTAALPLIYLMVGAAIQQFQDQGRLHTPLAGFVVVLLVSSVSPSIASNLKDGTRFDYRSAYQYIIEKSDWKPVFGTPSAAARFYAPDLDFHELSMRSTELQDSLVENSAIWVIASYRRYGLLNDFGGEVESWLWSHCELVHKYERQRFDYRRYATLLYFCMKQS